jgi:hypothetical protein
MSETDAMLAKLREFVAVLEFGELFPPSKVSEPPPNLGPLWDAARRSHDAKPG